METIHLIDIGNTSATYGKTSGKVLRNIKSVNYDDIPKIIDKNASSGKSSNNFILISSVVPKKTEKLISDLNAHRNNFVIYELGKDIKVPLPNKYKNAKKLGIDRKINAYGAIKSKTMPCLVFDYGTALTCDLINEKGVFLGGLIIPGPATSLKSLLSNTAMLPKLFDLTETPAKAYGQSTNECLQHGVIQAYAAMTDGLIAKLSKQFKKKPHVIITGGFSSFIGKIIHSKAEINPAHTLQSMLRLYWAQK